MYTHARVKKACVCVHIYVQTTVVHYLSPRGHGAMARAPDCLASHACVPGLYPAVLMWGFQRNRIVSPFSMWLGDHVNGGLLVELRLRPVYRRQLYAGYAGPCAARSSHIYAGQSPVRSSPNLGPYAQTGGLDKPQRYRWGEFENRHTLYAPRRGKCRTGVNLAKCGVKFTPTREQG